MELTLKEKNLMIQILENTKLISNLYRILYDEELKNGRDSVIYKALLNKLREAKTKEDTLYKNLEITPDKTELLMEYASSVDLLFKRETDNVSLAINTSNITRLIPHRIVNKIVHIANCYKKLPEWLVKEHLFFNYDMAQDYTGFLRTDMSIKNDFERMFLYFNECVVEAQSLANSKNYFLNLRYRLSFVSDNIQDECLYEDLSELDKIYIGFPLVAKISHVRENNTHFAIKDSCYELCTTAIKKMLLPDLLIDEKSELELKVYGSYLKAALSLSFTMDFHEPDVEQIKAEVTAMNDYNDNNWSKSTATIINAVDSLNAVKPQCKYLYLASKN